MSNYSILHMYFGLDKVILSCGSYGRKRNSFCFRECLICALNKKFKIWIGDCLGDLKLHCLRKLIHEHIGSKYINTYRL